MILGESVQSGNTWHPVIGQFEDNLIKGLFIKIWAGCTGVVQYPRKVRGDLSLPLSLKGQEEAAVARTQCKRGLDRKGLDRSCSLPSRDPTEKELGD